MMNLKPKEDKIRTKLISIKEWKIKTAPEKRIEYEKLRKDGGKPVQESVDAPLIPFEPTASLTKATASKERGSAARTNQRQTTTRFSCVFNKGALSSKGAVQGDTKGVPTRKDEKFQLQELFFDKTYINRVLWDEHVRMLFLRSGKVSQAVLKQKPYLRLWMEALMNKISEKSRNLRAVLRREITFLNCRYRIHRQLHFWQTLHSLTLDQLYHKKRQMAFKKRIRYDSIYEQLEFLWNNFNKGFYSKVNKISKNLIFVLNQWTEENRKSIKFKALADLNYVRGLSLMHLEQYDLALSCFRKDAEIGEAANLKVSLDRTKDNIGRIQAIKGNYKQAIKLWTERLDEAKDNIEKAWLYYGIAQCYALEENYEKSIEIVNKCIQSAEKSKNFCWELNGNLLLANCSAMLGMIREANIRSNTVTSLKAIHRAYQCAVYLANVSVIKRIMDIVVHIYNSFKDIDLTILEEVWSIGLLEFARKAATVESEKNIGRKNMNLSNANKDFSINDSFQSEQKVIKSKKPIKKQVESRLPRLLNSETHNYRSNKDLHIIENKNVTTVKVCCEEKEVSLVGIPKEKHPADVSNRYLNSPITAVEVITTDEVFDKTSEDEWITESEYEDDELNGEI